MRSKGLAFLLASLLALPLLAQETTPAKPATKTPVVRARQKEQQKRIGQGVASGQLTPGETKHLEKQQAKIQADKKAAKADGNVTPQERAKLAKEQNKANRTIYRDKHNARTAPKQ